ncbi:hypothetical protein VP01_776g1 [Puccinia sorghi]|uniref:Uncharacterized protein n=1 Tax=Puccinia sorghi TaxID=27349 RepID=A0A0L6UBA1_9BASI|nr:hypothetical protein VP01_776g1 [Puccinia sorghi]
MESVFEYQEILFKGTKVEDVENLLLGSQVYVGYPFVWEAKLKAILESLLKMPMGLSKRIPRGVDWSLAIAWTMVLSEEIKTPQVQLQISNYCLECFFS